MQCNIMSLGDSEAGREDRAADIYIVADIVSPGELLLATTK